MGSSGELGALSRPQSRDGPDPSYSVRAQPSPKSAQSKARRCAVRRNDSYVHEGALRG
jgi:hypothetical protein